MARLKIEGALLLSVASLFSTVAAAANYFVDASRGNDAWTGRKAEPTGSPAIDGPWQSLAQISRAALVPGDTVSLRCGSVWSETLKLPASGTASLPVSVNTYPTTCAGAAPLIDGYARITADQWVRKSSNVYAAQLPLGLVQNGQFLRGTERWQVWSPLNDGSISVLQGCGPDTTACLQAKAGTGSQNTVVYTNTFRLVSGPAYRLKADLKVAAGQRVRVFVRRGAPPYDTVGISFDVTGTGQWQALNLAFGARSQLENARLDLELPPGAGTVMVDNVAVEQQVSTPLAVAGTGAPMTVAHHPNRGFNALEPSSLYARTAGNSDVVATSSGTGSTYLVMGTDLALPAGASLTPGTTVRIRVNAWLMDERKVVSVAGTKLFLDRPTTYPVKAGWGFFILGSEWMLDEAHEWHFDTSSQKLAVRTPTDTAPGSTVLVAALENCVDLTALRSVVIEGLDVRGCRVGVRGTATSAVSLRRMRISDVSANGVFAPGSVSLQLANSRIERAGEHAVLGIDKVLGVATGMSLVDNTFTDSAAVRANGLVISLPIPTTGAVIPGPSASLQNNVISGSGYHGARTYGGGLVKGNVVESTCLVLDDCGGIYAYGIGDGSVIEDNIVRAVVGAQEGKPIGSSSQSKGIYLDENAYGFDVRRNTVSDASTGIFLHNAYNNSVTFNTLYGNRDQQMWLFEETNRRDSRGDIYGNIVSDNVMFSTTPVAGLVQKSIIKDTTRFAHFDRNKYSSLISNRVVLEEWPTGGGSHDFPSWQRVTSPTGVPRLPDQSGAAVGAVGYAAFKVLASSIVPNGDLSVGAKGWTPWNDTAPLAQAIVSACGAEVCLTATAGATTSLLASPPFSVAAGSWYRVAFDIRSTTLDQSISLLVRRGGGGTNGYESLMGSADSVLAVPAFKRYSFTFKATKTITAGDPVTLDMGARLYFDKIKPGNGIQVANVEVVPVSAVEASLTTRLLSNTAAAVSGVACPEPVETQWKCSQYINFVTGAAVSWPLQILAKSSAVVYTRDTSLVDSDGDGISDQQDSCAGTTIGMVTNARGCSRAF